MTTIEHPARTSQHNGGLRPGQSVTTEVRPFDTIAGRITRRSDCMIRRAQITGEPNTWSSIPARVSIGGRTIRGYVTIETIEGWSTATPDDPAIYVFVPFTGQLPDDAERYSHLPGAHLLRGRYSA